MHGRVPLARRNLFAEPCRFAVSAAGVGMPIMLILLLDGLWAGIEANITTYEDNVGAELYVAQPGTRNFFAAISLIPADTVETGARRQGALNLRVRDIDTHRATVWLRKRNDTEREQPASPYLVSSCSTTASGAAALTGLEVDDLSESSRQEPPREAAPSCPSRRTP